MPIPECETPWEEPTPPEQSDDANYREEVTAIDKLLKRIGAGPDENAFRCDRSDGYLPCKELATVEYDVHSQLSELGINPNALDYED